MDKLVFLSHSSKDKLFVRRLDAALRRIGINTFLDERNIKVGQDIPQRIHQTIEDATHVVYVISKHSVRSQWGAEELSAAKMSEKERQGVFILPVLLDDVKVPMTVKSKRYADFRNVREGDLDPMVQPFRDLLIGLCVEVDRRTSACNNGIPTPCTEAAFADKVDISGTSSPDTASRALETLLWLRKADSIRTVAEANGDFEKLSEAIRLYSLAEAWDKVGAVRRTVAELMKEAQPRSKHIVEEYRLAAEAFHRGSQWHEAGSAYEEIGLFRDAALMYDKASSSLDAARMYEKDEQWEQAAERFCDAAFALEENNGRGVGELLGHAARMYERSELWDKAGHKYHDSGIAYGSRAFTWGIRRFTTELDDIMVHFDKSSAKRMFLKAREMFEKVGDNEALQQLDEVSRGLVPEANLGGRKDEEG